MHPDVTPAEAGVQSFESWIPTFVGMTKCSAGLQAGHPYGRTGVLYYYALLFQES